jgi:DNA-binding Lrp family transcriptional regulator
MKKSENRKREILFLIKENPGISSVQIAQVLKLSRIAIYKYLVELLGESQIEKQGNKNSTRYYSAKISDFLFDTTEIEKKATEILEEVIGKIKISLISEAKRLVYVIMPSGEAVEGFAGIYELLKRERNGGELAKEEFIDGVVDFFLKYWDEEPKRRKNGFFDGTASLENIMKKYNTPISINKLYFSELSYLSRFGRLRTANEISLGKLKSNRKLLQDAIHNSIEKIHNFLVKEEHDAIILTPPTIHREVQFRDVLLDEIILISHGVFPKIIEVEKNTAANKEFQPQKDLKGYARIINADESIIVKTPGNVDTFKKIIIFDDNFTTGATMNAIASKVRSQGFTGKIIAITITGNFHYIPGVSDIGDV